MLPGHDLVHTMAASALLPFRRLDVRPLGAHRALVGHPRAGTVPCPHGSACPATMRLLTRPDVVVAVGSHLAEASAEFDRGPSSTSPMR